MKTFLPHDVVRNVFKKGKQKSSKIWDESDITSRLLSKIVNFKISLFHHQIDRKFLVYRTSVRRVEM